ncbi:hypothetical protein [Bacillus suaedae]|nr:hypothetical protein [Bacillus suaedae]
MLFFTVIVLIGIVAILSFVSKKRVVPAYAKRSNAGGNDRLYMEEFAMEENTTQLEKQSTSYLEEEIGEDLSPFAGQITSIQSALSQLQQQSEEENTAISENENVQSTDILQQIQQINSQTQQQQQNAIQELQQSIDQATQMLGSVGQTIQTITTLNQITQQINQIQLQVEGVNNNSSSDLKN